MSSERFLVLKMTLSSAEFEEILEDEWYVVRHSGEIPEIALCSALYYLAEDRNGPRRALSVGQKRMLVEAAELRYREIVLRDLHHANRQKRIYRGPKRSMVNWYRYEKFCLRQEVDSTSFSHEVAAALLAFLSEEVVDVARGRRVSALNCTYAELRTFAAGLGLTGSMLPEGLVDLCLES